MENTFFESPEFPILDKLKRGLTTFVKFSMALLVTLIFIKLLEYLYFIINGQNPQEFLKVVGIAFIYDLVFFVKCLPFLFIPYLIFFFSLHNSKANAYKVAMLVFSVFILIYLLLIKYYFTALVPLGSDLFGYSIADIKKTVSSSVGFDLMSIVVILLPFALLWYGIKYLNKRDFVPFSFSAILLVIGIVLFYFNVSALPSQTTFKSDYSYNSTINKDAFFFEKSYAYLFNREQNIDIYSANYFDDQGSSGVANSESSFKYVSGDYPFLRENNTTDVLGNFFTIDTLNKPNFVFIQVEGLGRAYSGPNAYLGSFTPFLDQLRTKSLYFENFLSSQGRTFASLPSILGSLPFFDKGFNDLGRRMPPAITTLSLLKHNGYNASYNIATDLDFDNQGMFIRSQGVNKLISKNDFTNYPSSHNTYWGYPDHDLMEKVIGEIATKTNSPFVSYIQTISMHTPYKVPEMDKYYQMFESQMNKLGFDEAQKNERRSNRDQFACILYSDAALQYFFTEFAKLPAYKNTIFIITGDHRLPEIPMSTKIDRYHVPLIIFSPMLKRSATIRSISSQFDITPSLMTFMSKNYKFQVPKLVTWVGAGLDTVKQFRNIHRYPLKQTVSSLIDYISGEYFLNDNTLYSVGDNFDIRVIDDDTKKNQLISEFNQYKSKNTELINSLKLMPDSIIKKFKP
jgi:uncharacterized sulfatase